MVTSCCAAVDSLYFLVVAVAVVGKELMVLGSHKVYVSSRAVTFAADY